MPTRPPGGNMAIRLLLADVDGTLVTQDKVLTDRAIAAVRKLKQAGDTLRDHQRPPAARHVDADRAARAQHADRGVQRRGLRPPRHVGDRATDACPTSVTPAVIDLLDAHGVDVWVYRGADWFVRDPQGPHVDREAWTVKFDPTPVDSFAVGLGRGGQGRGGERRLRRGPGGRSTRPASRFGDHVSAARSQPYYADITHPDANKGARGPLPLAGLRHRPRRRSPPSVTCPTTC